MQGEPITVCIMSGESECCVFGECSMFKQCFPEAYEDWQKQINKDKRG